LKEKLAIRGDFFFLLAMCIFTDLAGVYWVSKKKDTNSLSSRMEKEDVYIP